MLNAGVEKSDLWAHDRDGVLVRGSSIDPADPITAGS